MSRCGGIFHLIMCALSSRQHPGQQKCRVQRGFPRFVGQSPLPQRVNIPCFAWSISFGVKGCFGPSDRYALTLANSLRKRFGGHTFQEPQQDRIKWKIPAKT